MTAVRSSGAAIVRSRSVGGGRRTPRVVNPADESTVTELGATPLRGGEPGHRRGPADVRRRNLGRSSRTGTSKDRARPARPCRVAARATGGHHGGRSRAAGPLRRDGAVRRRHRAVSQRHRPVPGLGGGRGQPRSGRRVGARPSRGPVSVVTSPLGSWRQSPPTTCRRSSWPSRS